jgi:hypothetical protein
MYGSLVQKPVVRDDVTFKKQLHVTTNGESDFEFRREALN